jgi:hypothetical protein
MCRNSEQSKRCNDRRLGNIGGGDWHLKITLAQIKFTEDSATIQAGCQIRHVRQRVLILHCLKVQLAVIAAWSP